MLFLYFCILHVLLASHFSHLQYISRILQHRMMSGLTCTSFIRCLDREIDEAEISALERRLVYAQEMCILKKKKINQARIDLEHGHGGYQEVRVYTQALCIPAYCTTF